MNTPSEHREDTRTARGSMYVIALCSIIVLVLMVGVVLYYNSLS